MEDMNLQALDESGEAILFRAMRQYWQPVMYAHELGETPAPATVLGEALVVARLDGEVCIFPDLCAHRGSALSLGTIDGDQLRCAYHGWTYGPDGVCTSIPARFGMNIPARAKVRRYRAAEQSGLIWACLDGNPRHPVPEFPEFTDPAFRPVPAPTYDWQCNFARRVENYCDFAHFAWVHDGILGDHNSPEVPDHEVWREGAELRMTIAMQEPTSNPRNEALEAGSEGVYTHKEYRMYIPNAIWLRHRMSEKEQYVLFMTVCPMGPKRTRTFTYLTRNYDFDSPDQKYVDYNTLIIEQDKPVVESQRPEELPVDLSAELHIRGVDRVSVEYRKWLIEIARNNGWKE
jgi:vanillate O-demethylase monooxygenase subunit